MNIEAHNAGFITYVAIFTMSFLLVLAFMGLRIGQICESNAVDELHLEEAHYAAQSGAHWFVGYCKAGNTWDFQGKLIVADDADVEITIEADPSSSCYELWKIETSGNSKSCTYVCGSRYRSYYACYEDKTILR